MRTNGKKWEKGGGGNTESKKENLEGGKEKASDANAKETSPRGGEELV